MYPSRYFILVFLLAAALLSIGVKGITFPPTQGISPLKTEKKSHFPVEINQPNGSPKVNTAQLEGQITKTAHPDSSQGKGQIRCATCHSINVSQESIRSGADLKKISSRIGISTRNLTCVSCHHSSDYDSLRGADNRKIPFSRVMELCSQCHGPQARDYQHGAHGGMAGYWDLTKGPRKRNNCVDCHDPHTPAYPKVLPVFPPINRGGIHHGGQQ